MKVYPDGLGVAVTETLHNVAHASWGTDVSISPVHDEGGDPPLVDHTAHDGTLVLHATNLNERDAVGGVSHAWPQSVAVDLYSKPQNEDCGGTAYLDAQRATVSTKTLVLDVYRSGTVAVYGRIPIVGGARPAGNTWLVTVTAHSPGGVQHHRRSVRATDETYHVQPAPRPHTLAYMYRFSTRFKGFTNLRNFTSVTVTASKAGKHRTWMTLSRTP